MKTLKRIFASTLLILAISVPLFAGDIHVPAYTCPSGSDCGSSNPPPARCGNCDQIESSDAMSSTETTSLETPEFAVDLLLALLSLF